MLMGCEIGLIQNFFLIVADNICETTAVVAELSVCRLFTSAALINILGFLGGGNTDSSL